MENNLYDIAILGCGPAGLSAAINASVRNKKVIILGSNICSPPLNKAPKINNYLGFCEIKGEELLGKFLQHAVDMGIIISENKAETVSVSEEDFDILSKDELIKSRAIIIATGIPYNSTIQQEEKFIGQGLGYCATCDGPLYRGKDVLIIGHNNEAEDEANFMAQICNKVYYLPLYQNTRNLDGRVEIIESQPAAIIGENYVEGLLLKDERSINIEGLFIIGAETAPDRLIPGLDINNNHIQVNRSMETNIPGVYAAGDCTGAPYQVAKSVGEGQIAGLSASKYVSINKLHRVIAYPM